MNTLEVKGRWNVVKGRLKQKFAHLTGDELQFMEGKQNELVGRIQQRSAQADKDLKRVIAECWGCHE